MRKLLFTVLTGVLVFGGAVNAAVQSPEDMVRDTSQRALAVLDKDLDKIRSDPAYVYKLIDEIILPVLDFEAFSKLTLGKNWKTATPQQRERFMAAFKDMLVRTYTKSLTEYQGAKIEIAPPRDKGNEKYQTVDTRLSTNNGASSLQVSFRFRRSDSQWKAYDLEIDGLSMVKNFRTSFTQEINQTSLDALIDRLAKAGTDAGQ